MSISGYRPAAEPDDMVYPVACVSFPRSGHHLLVRMLTRLYRRRFGYCTFHRHEPGDGCCGMFPCADPKITLSKQHDFDLDQPIPRDRRVIVQFRRFDEAVISNFELHVSNGRPDTFEEFRKFSRNQAKTYRGFMEKWVHSDITSHRLAIDYARLIEDPEGTLRSVTEFVGDTRFDDQIPEIVQGLDHVSHKNGRSVTKGAGVVNLRSVQDFRFYRRHLFDRLDELAYGFESPLLAPLKKSR